MSTTAILDICAYIKKQILSESYKEGDRISERTICEFFGVSRTVVREALFILKKDGWIYAESKSGTYVAALDLQLIEDNYKARMSLEPSILLMAYPRMDVPDFEEMKWNCDRMESAETIAEYSLSENDQHKIIHRNVDNFYIRNFMESMMDGMTRVGSKCGNSKARQADCTEEWRGIIRSLERHDPHTAIQQFARHIQNSYEAFMRYYRQPSERTYHIGGEVEWL